MAPRAVNAKEHGLLGCHRAHPPQNLTCCLPNTSITPSESKIMDENRLRFGVGVLVVAALGIAVILTFFFGAYPNLFAGRYTVTVRFDAAPGSASRRPC